MGDAEKYIERRKERDPEFVEAFEPGYSDFKIGPQTRKQITEQQPCRLGSASQFRVDLLAAFLHKRIYLQIEILVFFADEGVSNKYNQLLKRYLVKQTRHKAVYLT